MRTRALYFVLGAVVALAMGAGVITLSAQGQYQGPRWEYQVLVYASVQADDDPATTDYYIDGELITVTGTQYQLLDQMGAEGWELSSSSQTDFIFKRPLSAVMFGDQ